MGVAIIFCVLYLAARRESENISEILKAFFASPILDGLFLIFGLGGATIAGIAMHNLKTEIEKQFLVSFVFDLNNFKIRYYKPYLYVIPLVIVAELLRLILPQ